jgi:hypothetical protein
MGFVEGARFQLFKSVLFVIDGKGFLPDPNMILLLDIP